ncbi:EAL domain-containing protein [Thalassotalea euphylliae]|uniref:two-component system response regulator n=1 Tax=Thalassotalea euphylliae TaxID=1655234 RepID=UPI0036391661
MNVLLVDDQEIDRELVKEALHCSGCIFDIKEVNNAHDGLSEIQACKYDVVLLDYQMPRMNGMQLLQELQLANQDIHSTVIVISNNKDEDVMLSCINAGAQDFILKQELTSTHLIRCIKQSQQRLDLQNKLTQSYNEVKRLAERDALTGLFNRHYFEAALTSLLYNARALDGLVAVMLLDIDGFKMVNDSLGHSAGDMVLQDFAGRIQTGFRESQLFARIGGDEFAFVFSGVKGLNAAMTIAKRLLTIFDSPFDYERHQIFSSASVGIAISTSDSTALELIKQADIAMYKAKSSGKNQACFYEESLEHEFFRSFNIENELREAIRNEAFKVFFQPIFNCQTKELAGFEALVRWPSGKTTQNPEEFIQVAENCQLIEPLGRWIIQEAISLFAELTSYSANSHLSLSINLSPLQMHDLNLPGYITELTRLYGVDLHNIIVEVTETALLENSQSTLETLEAFKHLQCKVALDDFGTGFSSISHLLNYPIDVVKFDKSLIVRTVEDEKARAMLQGLASMLHSIGIETVAEGVEYNEHVDICEQSSVSRLQGYLLGKPMPKSDCQKLI